MSRLPIKAFVRVRRRLNTAFERWRSHDRLRVYIAHDALALCRIQGRLSSSIVEKAVVPVAVPADPADVIPSMLAALKAWLHSRAYTGDIEWIIGFDHVHYLILPWDERIVDSDFCFALANALFAQQRSSADNGLAVAEIRFAPIAYGRPRLAALIPRDLLRMLTSFSDHQFGRTTKIAPALSVVWDQFTDRLRRTKGTLTIVEGTRLLRISYEQGNISELTVRPYRGANSHPSTVAMNFLFPANHADTLVGDGLQPDCMDPDDDERLGFALCGVR